MPDEEDPGLSNPGEEVFWCVGEYQDNWVVHLSKSMKDKSHDLMIYDVAEGGNSTYDRREQVLQLESMVDDDLVRVDESAMLVLWIGINDVAMHLQNPTLDIEMYMLEKILDRMYALGFRNLVLIDVPPRRPSMSSAPFMETISSRISQWNDLLPSRVQHWISKPNTTSKIFSAHDVFTEIFDDPTKYGFKHEDPDGSTGGIWVDGLHPTSQVHKVLADELEKFLSV
ncbi:hypothetical protein V866_002088 [Kwoniella sp. B9012]